MESEEVDFTAARQCVCTAARRRSRDLTRAFEKAMRGSGVRGTQFTLLATLIQTGPIPTTRLADFQGLERTTLTRNLGLLVRDGLVRIDEGEDRRVRKVAITPAGEEAARRAYPFWKKAQDAALAAARPWRRPRLKICPSTCSYTLMEASMLDILSTAELTRQRFDRRRLSVVGDGSIGGRPDKNSGRARRMVRAGSGDRGVRRAQPRGWRRARARPDGDFAHRSAGWGVFRSPLDTRCDGHNALAGAHRPACDPPARIHLHHSLCRGPPSRAVCAERRVGRCVHRRNRAAARLGGRRDLAPACDRSSSYGMRSGSPTSSLL